MADFEKWLNAPYDEAVDARRNAFHVNFIASSDLEDRLTSQSYRPEIVDAMRDLRKRHSCRPLSNHAQIRIRQGITPEYSSKGPPCLKLKDVRHILVDLGSTVCVSHAFAQAHADSVLQNEAVFINRSGGFTVGRSGAYLRATPVFVSDDVFAFVPKSSCDAGFIASFLNSWWGKRALEAGINGSTGQLKLPLSHITSLPIPEVAWELQRAIGNKVRKAQRLRELSLTARSEIREHLDKFVAIGEPVPARSSWTPSQLIYPRIDPRPYGPHYLAIDKAVRRMRHVAIREVATIRGGDAVSSDLFGKTGIGLVRIRDISPDGFETSDVLIPESYCAKQTNYMATKGLVVVGMDGEFRSQFFLPDELPRLINQRVAMITTHSLRPELLSEWLNRPIGQFQLSRWSVKTTVEHISLDDIREVLIPRMDFDTEEQLSNRISKARQDNLLAERLLNEVKNDVEGVLTGCYDTIQLERDGVAASAWLEANPHIV